MYGSDSEATKLYSNIMLTRDRTANSLSSFLDGSAFSGGKQPLLGKNLETESLAAASGGDSIGSLGTFDE